MPLIAECPVNIECALKHIQELPDSYVFIADIAAVYARSDAVVGGKFALDKTDPFAFTMDGLYRRFDKPVGTAWKEGESVKQK